MPRQIVQIAVAVLPWTREGDNGERIEDFEENMYALADDGTVWYSVGNSPTLGKGWSELPPLPQADSRFAPEPSF